MADVCVAVAISVAALAANADAVIESAANAPTVIESGSLECNTLATWPFPLTCTSACVFVDRRTRCPNDPLAVYVAIAAF